MKNWKRIDKHLKHLAHFKSNKEWEDFFDTIIAIREADNQLKGKNVSSTEERKEFKTRIEERCRYLDDIEPIYISKVVNDKKAFNAVYKTVDILCNEFLFKDLKFNKELEKKADFFLTNLHLFRKN